MVLLVEVSEYWPSFNPLGACVSVCYYSS